MANPEPLNRLRRFELDRCRALICDFRFLSCRHRPAPRGDNYKKWRAENRAKKLKTGDEETKALSGYAWVDRQGQVRLPIDRAMD